MCDPVSLTSVGLAVAGTVAGEMQSQAQNTAMSKATDDYNQQYSTMMANTKAANDALAAKRDTTLEQSENNANLATQQQQTAAKQSQLQGQYQTATAVDPTQAAGNSISATNASQQANPNNTTANSVVAASYAQQYKTLNDYLTQQAGAKATLDAQRGQTVDNGIFNSNQGDALNMYGNEVQGNNASLQTNLGLENEIYQNNLRAAQTKGGIFGALGGILGGASQAAGKGAGRTTVTAPVSNGGIFDDDYATVNSMNSLY